MKSKLSNVQIDISVVMPIYNSSKYLEETLKSVLEQKKINLELICVDDGSTDNSIEIIKSKAQQDPRVKLLSQDHLGAGVARNVGLKEVKVSLSPLWTLMISTLLKILFQICLNLRLNIKSAYAVVLY